MPNPRDLFFAALHREKVSRIPTGSATSMVTTDLMEKIGVFFPEAHLDAEKMAVLAGAGHTEIGFDNVAPLFSVWHESAAMGCKVDWGKKDLMPGCREALYKIGEDIKVPPDLLKRQGCAVPIKAIGLLRKMLGNDVAIVGKVFGPWTLGYHMFGVQEFLMNTLLQPDLIKKAIDELKPVSIQFGMAQIEAGADALCFADHATRDLCSPDAYRDFLKDLHAEVNEILDCPLLLHICGDTSDRIPYIRETGIACFHYDSKVPTEQARQLAGDNLALIGGTSNIDVILNGTEERIVADVKEKIENHIDIIGPECAVPLNAPYRNMKILVDEVKKQDSGN
jgi:[methyl-Co(III) methanol-specific corrinoid protein]:coenzyme M methyltransferase